MSGIHVCECGGPDNVIYFLADLLAARKAGSGILYRGKNYTAEDIETALSAGIIILPLTNPDGVAYNQTTDTYWRKNRSMELSSGTGDGSDVGVDLNRNYDFVWDYKKAFNPNITDSPVSDNPANLHSYTGSILYAWGDNDTDHQEAEQNFVNTAFDGKRGYMGEDPPDSIYKEYFTAEDLETEKDVTSIMVEAILVVGNVPYDAYPAVGLYPTSGASNDYAMGRYYSKLACGSSRMFGLTLEFGAESSSDPSCPFYPDAAECHHNIRQVGAGFMEMMLLAAGPAADPLYLEC